MTGADFEHWAKDRYPRLEQLAAEMEWSLTTLYKKFKVAALPRSDVLALSAKGCPKAVEETRQHEHRTQASGA